MINLEPPDIHFIRAAQGWLELGNYHEANVELDKITPALKEHPAILELRWHICIKANQTADAEAIANNLIKIEPKRAGSWIKLAQSYYYRSRYQEAYNCLGKVLDRFPDSYEPCYDMACYACLLGHMDEAKTFLKRAFELGDYMIVKKMALADQDLEPLWKDIGAGLH